MKTGRQSQGGTCNLAASALALALLLPASGHADAAPVSAWTGVYKSQFDNALVSGERYRSENILEVAAYSPEAAYLRLHLEFANGHQCALWGIAEVVGPALVYRAPASGADRPCVLTLRRGAGKLTLDDQGDVCRLQACGARGIFSGIGFPLSARRPIRYLPRLKASSEYRGAAEAYETRRRRPG
jgi:hypothetical protein